MEHEISSDNIAVNMFRFAAYPNVPVMDMAETVIMAIAQANAPDCQPIGYCLVFATPEEAAAFDAKAGQDGN